MLDATIHSQAMRWWPDPSGKEYSGEEFVEHDGRSTRHNALMPCVWLVWTRNLGRRAAWLDYGRKYGGVEWSTITPLGIDPASQVYEAASLPYNIIRSGVNTLVAKVAKSRPVPMYLPVDGDHRIQKRVRYLNRFVGGLFHKHKVHHYSYIACRDAALYGTGLVLVGADGDKVTLENLYPWEVYTDPVDSRYGYPKSLFLVRYLDKDDLKARFPEHAEAIERAPVLDEAFFPVQDVFSMATRCTVVEAWHLPSKAGETKDGRHTICLLDETLLDEQYDEAEYPIVRLQKDAPLAGWWGLGLGDEMSAFQDEQNRMAERVQYAHAIAGGQFWLVPDGGGFLDTDFTDDIGVVLRYQGGPNMVPECVNPQPLHPQTYEYHKDLPVTAFAFSGISTASAQSQKPPGVTAALALQTLDDMETDRFIMFERAYEEFHVELGRQMLRQVRKIAKAEGGDFEVFSANKGSGKRILWNRDVDLEEDSYVVQSWPTSLLPKTPSAKLQRVIELATNQIFDKAQVLKLLDLPDTSAEERLLLSPREAAEAQIQHILECDDPRGPTGYIPPGDFQDLAYSMSRAQQEYNMLQADAIDSGTLNDPTVIARLANLGQYAADCHNKIQAAQAFAQAQAAAAQAAPQMTGGAAPAIAAPQQARMTLPSLAGQPQ